MDVTLQPNQLVWAKLVGFPWWPAYIKSKNVNNCYEVEYFGDFERNYFDSSKIRLFSEMASQINRKNIKLMESYRQALRIANGETTIEKEREKYFKKKIEPESLSSINCKQAALNDVSTTISAISPVDLVKGVEVFPRTTKSSDSNFVEAIENLNVNKLIKKKIRKTNKNLNQRKETRKSHPDFTKTQSMPIKLQLPTASVIGSTLFFEDCPIGAETQVMANIQTFQKEADIIELEAKLRETSEHLTKERPMIAEIRNKLKLCLRMFIQNENSIDKMFQTDIGKLLSHIGERCRQLALVKTHYKELHISASEIIEQIQQKLLISFFQVQSFEVPRSDFSINRLESNIIAVKKPFNDGDVSFLTKFPQSSNCNIPEALDIENNVNFSTQRNANADTPDPESRKVSEETIFRVCKKVAKLLYTKLGTKGISKADCERAANLVEVRIRGFCKTEGQYQQQIVLLLRRLSKKWERFLMGLKGSSQIGVSLPIYDIVQSLLIKK